MNTPGKTDCPLNLLFTREVQESISQGLLPFQLIQDRSKVLVTSFGGLPLVMETFRALGLPQSIQKHLPMLQREGKYRETDYVESFISVFAAGGECVDDFERLRQDEGLKELVT